jgi:hypothetical protein
MITEITFEPELAKNLGLQPTTMSRLGKVVVLAGPNGSGKTRVLRLVARTPQLGRLVQTSNAPAPPVTVFLEYPQGLGVSRVRDMPPNQFRTQHAQAKGNNFNAAYAGIEVELTQGARILYDADHPRTTLTTEFVAARKRVDDLNSVIRALLGTEIGFNVVAGADVIPTLFGRRFDPNEMSHAKGPAELGDHLGREARRSIAGGYSFRRA